MSKEECKKLAILITKCEPIDRIAYRTANWKSENEYNITEVIYKFFKKKKK